MYVHINSSFPKENDTIFWHYFDHVTFGRRYFTKVSSTLYKRYMKHELLLNFYKSDAFILQVMGK